MIDFIIGLPPIKLEYCVYDAILVVVNCYLKIVKYIPAFI